MPERIGSRRRCLRLSYALALGVVACLASSALAQGKPKPLIDCEIQSGVNPLPLDVISNQVIRTGATKESASSTAPREAKPKAVAAFEGTVARGLKIVLTAAGSSGTSLIYRWVQIQGAPVELGDSTQPKVAFTVPDNATAMTFLLLVLNREGLDCATVTVPRPLGNASPADPSLRADAGDDQLGLVGRQITLNGIRSEPRGRIGYRWIQVAGPAVAIKIVEGHTYTFVPQVQGIYRFALVVASGSDISEPDLVEVVVGANAKVVIAPPEIINAGIPTSTTAPPSPEAQAKSLLASIEDGPAHAEGLANCFAGVADRMDLYETYAEVFSEMSRRLEAVLPTDSPARPFARAHWNERLFAPLTNRLILGLMPEGLDLARPEGQVAPLSPAQKKRLAELLHGMAAGFRAARTEQKAN
jgi:hypothetical protein